jgi:hypothetical protein
MEEQNNTIGTLSKILGHYPNDRQMHGMHNPLLGNVCLNSLVTKTWTLQGF